MSPVILSPTVDCRKGSRHDQKVADEEGALSPANFIAAGFCLLFVLWTVVAGSEPATKKIVSDVIAIVASIVGTVWGIWGARRRRREGGDLRGALVANLLTLGVATYGVGSALYAYYDVVLHQNPYPSWADAAYVLMYVPTMAGVLLLPARPMPASVRVRVLIDSLMVLTALVTFSWFFALGPTILAGSETLLGRILGAGYPIMDLAMMFCVMFLTGKSPQPSIRKARNLLGIAVVAFVVADTGYLYQNLVGSYQTGQPLDAGWFLMNLLVGQAAMIIRKMRPVAEARRDVRNEASRMPSLARTVLPYALVPAVALLIAYVYQSRVGGALATGVYTGATVLLVLILVRQFFAIAENSRLYNYLQAAYKELEAQATTDAMTGLPNHRAFQERLRTELGQQDDAGAPMSLLLLDVDRFKSYNDGFGHPAGDQALKIVAQVLRDNLRTTDLPARYGGEEFAVILPATASDDAVRVAERIRAACERTEFPHRGVTLSIGVATVDEDANPGLLIESADRALYAAKHGGRNQVMRESGVPTRSLDRPIEGGVAAILPKGWSLETSRQLGVDRLDSFNLLASETGPIVRALMAMLDLRDHEVMRHSDRVMRYCIRLAEVAVARDIVRVSPTEMNDLHLGALLHDIGKVGVPDAILDKPGALTPEEWEVVQRHPLQGAHLLAEFPELAGAVPVVRSHHERWDGTGYPDGLSGEAIPFAARLFALADTLDAMGSDRPYRKALPFKEIQDEVRRMSGKQFDPALVEAFFAVPERDWQALRQDEPPELNVAA